MSVSGRPEALRGWRGSPGAALLSSDLCFRFVFRAVGSLISMATLVPTLQVMAAGHDVSPLLRYLLPHLVQRVFYSSSGKSGNMEEVTGQPSRQS